MLSRYREPSAVARFARFVSFSIILLLLIVATSAAPQPDAPTPRTDGRSATERIALTPGMNTAGWYNRLTNPDAATDWKDDHLDQVAIGGAALIALLLTITALQRQRGARLDRLRDDQMVCRLIAENTSDMILRFWPDGSLADRPRPSARAMAWFPEASRQQSPLDVVLPADEPAVAKAIARAQKGECDIAVDFRINRLDPTDTWVEAVMRSVRNPITNAPDGYVAVFRNITDRHLLEAERNGREKELQAANDKLERLAQHLVRARDKAERASRAKSKFLSGMSHELRTPLNGILGYARLLQMEGGLTASQTSRLSALLKAGDDLLQMITCVLDLSEIESNQLALQTKKTDIQTIAIGCLDLIRPAAQTRGLALTMAVAPGTPKSVITDAARLRQVLLNLLDNAVKFTAAGSVELRLRPMAGATAMRIEVTDTGPGVDIGHRARLFQDFERLGAEIMPSIAGVGLGLALSARLAVLLGGQLGHENNPGGGSTFWLDLPVGNFAPHAGDRGEDQASATPATAFLRVLVVDDVAMNRDIAGSFLRSAGHTVICVDGGALAVTEVEQTDYDVVLMDVRMPEIDGLEAARRIRALPGPRSQVPIVALTAMAFSEQVAECRKAGMDDHLAKPFEPDALVMAVTAAARLRHAKSTQAAQVMDGSSRGALADPVREVEPPVLDPSAFERTAAFLTPDLVTNYLHTIAERTESLLTRLRGRDTQQDAAEKLAEAAHSLAGSAGMFGFERAAAVSRRFERAIQSRAPDVSLLADDLAAALEVTLQEIKAHPAHAPEA